jgi:hypothetical protein
MPTPKIIAQICFEVLLSALLYVAFFYINQFITLPLEMGKGVNWIFIPAGLRIFLTLIFNYSGALGLAIASLFINYFDYYEFDWTTKLGIAFICAIAPLLGRHFVIHNLRVNPDLSNISFRQLLIIIIAYSLLSSGLHQIWFGLQGLDSGSFNHWIAMFSGDIAGSILFVAIIKYGIDIFKGRLGRSNLFD